MVCASIERTWRIKYDLWLSSNECLKYMRSRLKHIFRWRYYIAIPFCKTIVLHIFQQNANLFDVWMLLQGLYSTQFIAWNLHFDKNRLWSIGHGRNPEYVLGWNTSSSDRTIYLQSHSATHFRQTANLILFDDLNATCKVYLAYTGFEICNFDKNFICGHESKSRTDSVQILKCLKLDIMSPFD